MAIRKACETAYEHGIFEKAERDMETGVNYQPKITFVAVQKRHKTRFFCQNPEIDGVGRVSFNFSANSLSIYSNFPLCYSPKMHHQEQLWTSILLIQATLITMYFHTLAFR